MPVGTILSSIFNGARMDLVRKDCHAPCMVWLSQVVSTCALFLALALASVQYSAKAQESTQPASNQTATVHGVVLSTVDQKPILARLSH